MFKDNNGGVKAPAESSVMMNPKGSMSGNRPNESTMAIPTSAPADAHSLGRMPPGSLK